MFISYVQQFVDFTNILATCELSQFKPILKSFPDQKPKSCLWLILDFDLYSDVTSSSQIELSQNRKIHSPHLILCFSVCIKTEYHHDFIVFCITFNSVAFFNAFDIMYKSPLYSSNIAVHGF